MATINRLGFGQVEPNHLSAQRTSQVYAQLPAHVKAGEDDAASITILENGQFVKYDYENGEVNFTGDGEWMMVWNEIKLYDERAQRYKDYAMQAKDFTPGDDKITHYGVGPFKGTMVPRVIKTNVGDIFTTNTLGVANTDANATVACGTYTLGMKLGINAKGFLDPAGDTSIMTWKVVKVYTLPDGQDAVKVQRIA